MIEDHGQATSFENYALLGNSNNFLGKTNKKIEETSNFKKHEVVNKIRLQSEKKSNMISIQCFL